MKTNVFSAKKKKTLIIRLASISMALISMSLAFLSGVWNNQTLIEKSAAYASYLSEKTDDNYIPIAVESNVAQNLPIDSKDEFYKTYGVFGEKRISFVPCVNADKRYKISCESLNIIDHLSFVFFESQNNVKYNEHYKHEYFPIELMFEGEKEFTNFYSACYISKENADLLLESRNLEKNPENYLALLGETLEITIEETTYVYMISNIYFNEGYYCNDFGYISDEYLITFSRFPETIKKEYCYFLNEYVFQNYYYLNHIKKSFAQCNYYYLNDSKYESFDSNLAFAFNSVNQNEWLSWFILSFACLIFLLQEVFFIIYHKLFSLKFVVLYIAASFVPYVFFCLIYLATANICIFSFMSSLLCSIMVLTQIVISLICVFKNFIYLKAIENA